jgi:hypothetical protein
MFATCLRHIVTFATQSTVTKLAPGQKRVNDQSRTMQWFGVALGIAMVAKGPRPSIP